MLDDPRALLARQLAASILESVADFDERQAAFDALAAGTLKVGEHEQSQLSPYVPAQLQTLKDVAKLCDAAHVRSTLEYERLERHLSYLPTAFYEKPSADAAVGSGACPARNVIIWAPALHARETALLAFALEELHAPVRVVCREGEIEGMHAQFLTYDAASQVLQDGCIVVDACIAHAGNAIALSDAGYNVVCSTSSGAIEYLDGVGLYEAWNHRSIFSAVVTALGALLPRIRATSLPTLEPLSFLTKGPPVSMIVRTFNRPQFLPRALGTLAQQTYEDLEIIVVNDGGEDVTDIVARVSNAKYISLERNGGTAASANAGLAAATGTYVGFLDDDDAVFPEHISVLVDALLRSGAEIAHTDTIAAHFEKTGEGEYRTIGYIVFLDGLVEPTDFYVTDAIGPMSVLMKRSLVLAAGGYHEGITHAEDWELYLNLSQHHDFVHVPRVTGVYSIRHDGSHMMSNSGAQIADAMEQLMNRYPLPHRPIIEAARRTSLQGYRDSGYKMRFPEPALRRT